MKVPPLLEALYRSDRNLDAFVAHALARAEGHIAANAMVFFPEYTDHSITHIEQTLQTAFELASDPARGLLSPLDAAVLVVSVALHDIGMYLSPEGFRTLTAPSARWNGVPYFDNEGWRALWEDYYAEATRFDGRKLRQLFGENYKPVRPLPVDVAEWTRSDYLLVGNFLRKYHPRLAHEIALFGLPGKGDAISICLSDSEDQRFLADMCGLVARSHGMDLRAILGYLIEVYGNQVDPRRVHPAFLGSLLRVADYFQIQATRAPVERTDVSTFQSPVSENEWKVHQSVYDIHNTSSDPEAIVVNGKPEDVESFLRLKEWLTQLQEELDRTWAVLGEVYGLQTHNRLNLFGLRIRRIRSNLDDVANFAKTVSYVPARIAFEAANADLLKLLVNPLYGDNPGIGLRELFQNAVDAVREFEDALQRHPELSSVQRYAQDADVVLKVFCDDFGLPQQITVTDRGIGMTAEIVREYFLKAGASFRRSDSWKREYEDKEGHSRVLRSGRFGVGALAAFLLGNEIEVTTRHALSEGDLGLKFSAHLEDERISVTRIACPVGTEIRVHIPQNLRQHVSRILPPRGAGRLPFDHSAGHYFLKQPSLVRSFPNIADMLPTGYLPQPTDESSAEWRWFRNSMHEKIFWTFRNYPHISCNGIVILNKGPDHELIAPAFKMPHISVFDRDGVFPINLQRTGLRGPLPFKDDLLRSIAEDILAHALVGTPETAEEDWLWGQHPAFAPRYAWEREDDWAKWLVGRQGIVLNEPNLVNAIKPKLLLTAVGGTQHRLFWGESVRRALPQDVLIAHYYPNLLENTTVRIKGIFQGVADGFFRTPTIRITAPEAFVPDIILQRIRDLHPGKEVSRRVTRMEKESSPEPWRHFRLSPSIPIELVNAIKSLPVDETNPVLFTLSEVVGYDGASQTRAIYDAWMKIVGTPEIPFDTRERSKLVRRAETQISEFMNVWRRMAAEEAARQQRLREDRRAKPPGFLRSR